MLQAKQKDVVCARRRSGRPQRLQCSLERDRAHLVSASRRICRPTSILGGLEATIGYKPAPDTGTFSYAAHAALVAVDPEIGDVEILDYVIVEDGGKLVNPMIVDGQIYGGLAQGIGTALYEEMPFDRSGQPLASTFADYLLPGPTEVPSPRVDHMETLRPIHGVRREGHWRGRRHRPAGGHRQRRQRRACVRSTRSCSIPRSRRAVFSTAIAQAGRSTT